MRILQLSKIDPDALATLRAEHDVITALDATPEDLVGLIADREVVIFRSGVTISRECMQQAPDLRLLVRAGAGLDNVDTAYATERGIDFHHIPGPSAQAVAELTIGLMISIARQVLWADRSLRAGRWVKSQVEGRLLGGRCLGIVGAGNIGSRVGEIASCLGMHPVGVVEPSTPETERALRERGIEPVAFDTAVSEADFLSVHVPLTDQTVGLIDGPVLDKMKSGAFLINLSRGGVVDEHALHRALTREGGLGGAALDVHAVERDGVIPPLANLDNVILTPHIGSTAVEAQRQIGEQILHFVREVDRQT
jgi:D-3-phosphoglycerate dehydrogenase / 2-oxoglutarate reductase